MRRGRCCWGRRLIDLASRIGDILGLMLLGIVCLLLVVNGRVCAALWLGIVGLLSVLALRILSLRILGLSCGLRLDGLLNGLVLLFRLGLHLHGLTV